MDNCALNRRLAVAGIVLAASVLLLASGAPPALVSARSGRSANLAIDD